MRTTYTIMALLATTLFSQTVAAKLGANSSTIQLENKIEVNVEAEIIDNINNMLSTLKVETIKTDAVKQLNNDSVESQTNELVQNVSATIPEFKFKFKVVVTD